MLTSFTSIQNFSNVYVPQPNFFAHGDGATITPSLAQGYLSHTFTATIAYIYIRTTLLKTDDPTITLCLNAVLCYDTCIQSPQTLFIRDIRGLAPPDSPTCLSCAASIALLDMNVAYYSGDGTSRGPVIPQRLAAPRFPGGRTRLTGARLELPIFFQREDNGAPGLSVADALSGRVHLRGVTEPARLGGKSSTYICINWPGIPEFKRQIQTRDQTQQRSPITLARLVKHVGRSVQLLFERELTGTPPISGSYDSPFSAPWRIGEGGIRLDELLIVGVVHVSPGAFQVVLQLARPRGGFAIL
ncbi:unnamed protein product [Peniophora sp. CBMAI 1063]|nr:unnamed protein product [Peniophora sp. CBMAI 1063]